MTNGVTRMSVQFDNLGEGYARDGVAVLKGVLDDETMARVDAAWRWSAAQPSPNLQDFSARDDEDFIADTGYSIREPVYEALLRDTVIPDIARGLFGGESEVWFLGEQIFLKQGPSGSRRTPWHQDTPYGSFEGPMLAAIWIPLEPLAREGSLEVVRGSHRGQTFNGSRFEPGDDTAPLYPESKLPRLPDIQAERDEWDIVGSELDRGDVIAFHIGCLHAGGGTPPGERRRTLVLRFLGEDVVWVERNETPHPDSSVARRARAAAASGQPARQKVMPLGEPVWQSGRFSRVRPWSAG
ncbi:MAG: hypothetical protein CMD83_03010 [Gammaproteobacteria bacterium]|nr:hypothetical protein [Gammaproteobacteria bacterium]